MSDKYTATWVSHSSMGDYLKCPRLYYLHNVYKDPKTGRKMTTVSPYMSLGIAVHNVVEGLGDYPSEERMNRDLQAWFDEEWEKVSGKKGGFMSDEEEKLFRERGKKMIDTVVSNPRFLLNKRIKLPRNEMPCNFYLSEDDNIILNGLVDWIEYLPDLPVPRPGQFCVYVLKCSDGSFYIGQTENYEKRLKEHESGQGAEWTKNHLPFESIHWEVFNTRDEAIKRESDLKTGFGRKWLKREYDRQGLARQAGDTLHIIDFKTGKNEEKESSLQMPIYLLLCNALQKRKVSKASYWYLETDTLTDKELPSYEDAYKAVYDVAIQVKRARDEKSFDCPKGEAGCIHCRPYEDILRFKKGEDVPVEYIGVGGFNQDVYLFVK